MAADTEAENIDPALLDSEMMLLPSVQELNSLDLAAYLRLAATQRSHLVVHPSSFLGVADAVYYASLGEADGLPLDKVQFDLLVAEALRLSGGFAVSGAPPATELPATMLPPSVAKAVLRWPHSDRNQGFAVSLTYHASTTARRLERRCSQCGAPEHLHKVEGDNWLWICSRVISTPHRNVREKGQCFTDALADRLSNRQRKLWARCGYDPVWLLAVVLDAPEGRFQEDGGHSMAELSRIYAYLMSSGELP